MTRTLQSVAATALLLALPAVALAANGPRFVLPWGVKGPTFVNARPSGLALAIDGRGIDANGYRPIEVEFFTTSGKPLVADRQVRLVLDFYRAGATRTARVSQIIELPEGSTRVATKLLAPQFTTWHMVTISTYEGGEKLLDLSHEYVGWPNFSGWTWAEARPAFLFIDSNVPPRAGRDVAIAAFQSSATDPSPTYQLPDVRTLMHLFPDISGPAGVPSAAGSGAWNAATTGVAISDTTLLTFLMARSRSDMLPAAELPDRWLELSQYDVIVANLAELRQMSASHPDRLRAVRDWLSTGPLLIVFGVDDDFAGLAEVESLLELPALPESKDRPELRGWNTPPAGKPWKLDLTEAGDTIDAAPEGVPGAAPLPQTALAADWTGSPPFVLRPAGFGRVVAIATDKPFPGKPDEWRAVFHTAGEHHWKWFRRTGFSEHQTNDDYWNFLIPGVGRAPVIAFLLLVSLFAVVIGPLNFLLLGRVRRLYLLLVTVPSAAAFVTACLFLFAVFSDGFSLRMRLRSFTDLDQPRGRAATWSRQSYYAALAPSQGLVFPDDAAVYPIYYRPSETMRDEPTRVTWDRNQSLTAGYIASRRATQVMVQRAAATSAKLVVHEGASNGQPPKVVNELATNVHYVLLADSRGDYFAGEKIAVQTSQQLKPTDLASAQRALRSLSDPARPVSEYDPAQETEGLLSVVGGGRRYVGIRTDVGIGMPQMAASLLEIRLSAALAPVANPPAPKSYIAIVEKSPTVVSGVSRGHQEASLHVVVGRY